MSTIKKLQQEITELTEQREEVFKQIAPLNTNLDNLYKKLKAKQEELATLKQSGTGFTIDELLLYNPLNETSTLSKAQRAFAATYGMSAEGYLPDSFKNGVYQKGFSVRFYREKHPNGWSVEQQVDKVLEFVNKYHDKFLPMKDGSFYFGVRERTLSADGVYAIKYDNVDSAKINKTTYGHTKTLRKGTLKEILLHTATHHYYE